MTTDATYKQSLPAVSCKSRPKPAFKSVKAKLPCAQRSPNFCGVPPAAAGYVVVNARAVALTRNRGSIPLDQVMRL